MSLLSHLVASIWSNGENGVRVRRDVIETKNNEVNEQLKEQKPRKRKGEKKKKHRKRNKKRHRKDKRHKKTKGKRKRNRGKGRQGKMKKDIMRSEEKFTFMKNTV